MTSRSRSDAIPAWFVEAMAPLVRRCRTENGKFSEDDARDYYAILKETKERFLKSAVARFLTEAKEPWFPMPAVLLDIARKEHRDYIRNLIETAPPCEPCQSSGLVTARLRGSDPWTSFACVACARGLQFRSLRKFDAAAMETWRDHNRRLMGDAPQKRLTVAELVEGIGDVPDRKAGA